MLRRITRFYLSPTRLSTNGMSHTCLYSPATELRRILVGNHFELPGVLHGIVVLYGLTSHSTHYRSFRRRLYGSDDPTNSLVALQDDGLPGQGPIPQSQQTKR